MIERYGDLSDEARDFISRVAVERQPSLRKLFDEANGVGLLTMALRLARSGKNEKEIYGAMLKRIESEGYEGRR